MGTKTAKMEKKVVDNSSEIEISETVLSEYRNTNKAQQNLCSLSMFEGNLHLKVTKAVTSVNIQFRAMAEIETWKPEATVTVEIESPKKTVTRNLFEIIGNKETFKQVSAKLNKVIILTGKPFKHISKKEGERQAETCYYIPCNLVSIS